MDDHNAQIDPEFAGLPLTELADAALDQTRALGAQHADFRVERIRGQRIALSDGRVVQQLRSFIGLGDLPPAPEWGSMISDGAVRFYYWWIAAGPGLAILSVVLAFNFLGDGLRDILDPRSAE